MLYYYDLNYKWADTDIKIFVVDYLTKKKLDMIINFIYLDIFEEVRTLKHYTVLGECYQLIVKGEEKYLKMVEALCVGLKQIDIMTEEESDYIEINTVYTLGGLNA